MRITTYSSQSDGHLGHPPRWWEVFGITQVYDVAEPSLQSTKEIGAPVGCPQQRLSRIRGQRSAVEIRHYRASFDRCGFARRATLPVHPANSLNPSKSLSQISF